MKLGTLRSSKAPLGGVPLVGAVLGLSAMLVVGCHGSDSAPTNTAHSTYNNKGQSAADLIGAARANRRPMDRGKGGAVTPPPGQ
jgi:hypothetical protein